MLSTSLLIIVLTLSCASCGSSGVKSQPGVMRESKDHLQQCPKTASGRRTNENSRAKKMLVPSGARSALICRYRGRTTGPIPSPEAEVLHAGTKRFQRLLRAFGQLEPVRQGTVACPAGRPLRYLIAFHYRNQHDSYVRVDFNGCGLVTNDALKTLFYPDESLRRLLR